MKITEQQVRYVADLANLSLTEQEAFKFQADLNDILGHMERLNEIDTSGVEPMAQVLYKSLEAETWRDDVERAVLGVETALANAPQAGSGHFKVPKVIER